MTAKNKIAAACCQSGMNHSTSVRASSRAMPLPCRASFALHLPTTYPSNGGLRYDVPFLVFDVFFTPSDSLNLSSHGLPSANFWEDWHVKNRLKPLILLVGAPRFELGTPSPPDWCANRAALRSDRHRHYNFEWDQSQQVQNCKDFAIVPYSNALNSCRS